ncbi:MAG: hypothetical protein QF903_03690 [Planctomycetota bacterium]|jgi:Sec-independent protein translocase protein TatA|nr:hypothetical protein [Planctomycetota bacterium]MDP6762715.1 hypothetical protein [Planctomycetota bacterium]MDP6988559.1 hypothetical protein [Planctomycetota bacterium]
MASTPIPLAFFGDIAAVEVILVAAVAVMVFGKDLPQVAAKAFVGVQKLRRSVSQVWRESGMNEEIRKLQRELDQAKRDLHRELPRSEELVADARRASEEVERAFHLGGAEGERSGPGEAAEEPQGEAERAAARGDEGSVAGSEGAVEPEPAAESGPESGPESESEPEEPSELRADS